MQVGDLVRFRKELGIQLGDVEGVDALLGWIGLVVEPTVEHQFEGTVAMIQWMCYDTPTPEYVADLEVICE